ncbi:MAG: CocE/NonD family hydrolase [Steroidobacteraceae bacterium]
MSLLSLLVARRFRLPRRVSGRVIVERDVKIPMRDGVVLLADRWYPRGAERAPLVLMRSPYGRGGLFGLMGRLFAERGFQVLLQSCRGTGGSGGAFDPMRQEQADGVDTVSWISTQPWLAGRLYTYGASYLGYTQWALAKEAGKRIGAMALQVTLSNFRNETLAFGGFTLEGSLQWTTMMRALNGRDPLWALLKRRRRPKSFMAKIHAHLPLNELDRLSTGETVQWWQEWVGHGEPDDPWWAKIDHSRDVGDIEAPAVMVGGWRDIFLPSQINDFTAMQAQRRDVWLTIGPWDHVSTDGMAESLRQALVLFAADAAGRRPFEDRDRVRLYVTGAAEWRDFPSWPPPGSRQVPFYLQPSAQLSTAPPDAMAEPTRYVYDPRDPTPSLHGPKVMGDAKTPDMSLLEARADTVSFTTSPLAANLDVIGPARVELCFRSDRAHTDFYICLCDVRASGTPLHVLDGYLRVRPAESQPDADGVRRISIECWPTAHRFLRGHRLRLIVASGAHPRYARNPGSGEPLGSATRMLPARQEIFHDAPRPSALWLSVCS